MDKLQKAHDTNAGIFRDSMMALDQSVQAISLALDDLACGRPVKTTVVNGETHVDYNGYLAQYRTALQNMKPETEESSLVKAEDEEVQIFGGSA